jgi:hypothetical protein
MANAIGKSKAHKILIPVSKCKITCEKEYRELPYNNLYRPCIMKIFKMLIESEND